MNLPLMPVDKANHFLYCVLLFVLVYIVARLAGYETAGEIAMTAVLLVATVKEIVDGVLAELQRADGEPPTHTPSFADWAVGVFAGLCCYALVQVASGHDTVIVARLA